MDVESLKKKLGLEPHPCEGGWFRQTWKSVVTVPQGALPEYAGTRAAGTAIYYLLEPGTFSEMHLLPSDEIFHFYLGDAVEMLQLLPDGSTRVLRLGQGVLAGEQVQTVVPGGVWQGSRLVEGGRFALLGCTVTPGFEYEDYEAAPFEELAAKWPAEKARIRALTRR